MDLKTGDKIIIDEGKHTKYKAVFIRWKKNSMVKIRMNRAVNDCFLVVSKSRISMSK